MSQLVWLRNDLRVNDNPALNAACLRGPTTCIFLVDASQWEHHDMSPWRVALTLRTVDCLSQQLAQLGIKLIIRGCNSFAEAPKVIVQCAQELAANCVFFNAEIALNEQSVTTKSRRRSSSLVSNVSATIVLPIYRRVR